MKRFSWKMPQGWPVTAFITTKTPPPACVAADGARLLFRRDADDGVTWIECDLARGSFAAAKYRGGSAAAVREFFGS